ncbi:MAG TPA: S-layer homology domain-containing protein, partial [Anaerovoracaceae bacterium]|nr:S-layer homology domain-containing protein [Anaerovoracaceae bacterium]
SNGKEITKFGGVVTVSIPYTLASGEKASGIKVYYVNEEGKLIEAKSSSYDESNKTATFQTEHFSKFLIAYNQITFKDIQGHWAQAYIESLANRDIINGMTETTFMPDGNITRAQFAKLLAGLEGVDTSKLTTSKFSDVSQNAWYSGAVAWASDNDITLGYANTDGTKNFNPNQNITRQDMAVMMKRYLDQVAKKTLPSVDAKIAFVDEKIIADYSMDAVLQLQQAGIINGKITQTGGIEFDPTGKLTRAEAAKIVASQL